MLIPKVSMSEFEKVGFKKCKKPYDSCYYKCFARGCKYIFISPEIVFINKWDIDDPRIHKKANCHYRDIRTAEDFLCELIKNNYVDVNY